MCPDNGIGLHFENRPMTELGATFWKCIELMLFVYVYVSRIDHEKL